MSVPSNFSERPAASDQAISELYELLPAHIRFMDAQRGEPLKALFAIFATESEAIDAHVDQVYDRLFVETAPEDALGELGALVGAEVLRPLPPGAGVNARAFIANIIRYRRGKGTARVLEELANDVTALASVVVEYFMRLTHTQSMMNVRLDRAGLPSLRDPEIHARVGSGFDRTPRLVNVRSIASGKGRHNIPNVGVHVVRPLAPEFRAPRGDSLSAYDADGKASLAGVPPLHPWGSKAGYFQVSAFEGEPVALFNPDRRAAGARERMEEVALRDRLRRLPLHRETDALRRKIANAPPAPLSPDLARPWFDAEGQPFALYVRSGNNSDFKRVPPEQILIANLAIMPDAPPANSLTFPLPGGGSSASVPIACALDPALGRVVMSPRASSDPVREVRLAYAYGSGAAYACGPHERNAADVPFSVEKDDFLRLIASPVAPGDPALATQIQSAFAAFADWAARGRGKRGFIVFASCDALRATQDQILRLPPESELHLVAAQYRRALALPSATGRARLGYLVRRDRVFTFLPNLTVLRDSAAKANERQGALVLDGLEFANGVTLGDNALSLLRIRYCRVRNAGAPALAVSDAPSMPDARIDGADIRIERSMLGPVRLGQSRGSLQMSDSALASDQNVGPTLEAEGLDASVDRCTILGHARIKSIDATNTIFDGAVFAIRRQKGCLRYCYAPPGPVDGEEVRTPRRYRCQPDLTLAGATAAPAYIDTDMYEPTFAMLHARTPSGILRGGEGDVAMGVFSAEAEALRIANLETLFANYLPFELEAGILDDTRSTAIASHRNVP